MCGQFALDQINMRNDSQKLAFLLLHFLEHDDRFLEHLGIKRSKAFIKEHGIDAHIATRERRNSKRQGEAHEESFATGDVVDRANGIAIVMVHELDVERIGFSHHLVTREHVAQIAVCNFQQIAERDGLDKLDKHIAVACIEPVAVKPALHLFPVVSLGLE